MRYRITKETKPKLPTYGKYKAKAVHNQVIESHQLYEEAARGTVLSAGVLEGLMMNVADAVWRHLRMGDKVDNLKDFRAKKHIRGVRLHFIPESEHGSPELYKDITFEKDKNKI